MQVQPIRVEYRDHMGTDASVVNAARVSFDKDIDPKGPLSPEDVRLIEYLARGMSGVERRTILEELRTGVTGQERFRDDDLALIADCLRRLDVDTHWSPFAHTAVQLRVTAPLFCARQLAKHQVGGVWNEVSRRYVHDEPAIWLPKVLHERADSAKQGCGGTSAFSEEMLVALRDNAQGALDYYRTLLDYDIAPEEARMVLPLNTMTTWIWTGSLLFFARVCRQRLDAHAQKAATQEVARQIARIVAPLFPVSWQALVGGSRSWIDADEEQLSGREAA